MGDGCCHFANAGGPGVGSMDPWCVEHRRSAICCMREMRQRAESAELGCEIAYQREPTQGEGDAHEDQHDQSMGASHGSGECFVAMGGWTGRRCYDCGRWVWGGPTRCRPSCSLDEARAFLEYLRGGGTIVSTAAMTVEQVSIARAASRLFVDEHGYGYVYVPGPHGDVR